MPTAAEILRELVAVPSVSAISNLPLLDTITALIEGHGWEIRRFPFLAEDGGEKANLLAVPRQFVSSLPTLDLLFVCHTDTVPYRHDWLVATRLEERDGFLHGCGACDVKGSLAALLAAALQVDASALPIPVGFAFTADEEVGCIGATRFVASGAVRPRSVVVCEPTSLRPATAGKGYGLAEVRVSGREAHSAFPGKGISAITIAAQLIVAIEKVAESAGQPADSRFDPPRATFNVGVVQGGTAKNIIAGECRFLVEWRPLPQQEPQECGYSLKRLAAEIEAAHPNCTIEVRILRADPGFQNAEDSKLGLLLGRMLGLPETGISFGSEATRFNAIAEEVVVIGPGDMETAHSERECVPVEELNLWTETVKNLLLYGCQGERQNQTQRPDSVAAVECASVPRSVTARMKEDD
jgi:acetylornithine deacetylase